MPSSQAQWSIHIVEQLDQELSKLKDRFQTAHELKVKWMPDGDSKKSGSQAQQYTSTKRMRLRH